MKKDILVFRFQLYKEHSDEEQAAYCDEISNKAKESLGKEFCVICLFDTNYKETTLELIQR